MKATSLTSVRPLKTPQFWLLAIAGGLIAVHLSLIWRLSGDFSRVSISLVYWGAVLSLLWDKRHTLSLKSDIFSSLLGLLFIAFVLLRGWFMTSFDAMFELFPFMAGLGLAILASGLKGLQQYWQELVIILAFTVPLEFLVASIHIATFTAKFATFILSQLGFKVFLQGVNILLPTGAVEVNPGCSGVESIVRLLQLAVMFLVMFPTDLAKKFLVPVVAVLVAFVVNSVRVALMAILVAYSNQEAFNYWHQGSGSQIFVLISSLVFGIFCYFITQKDDTGNHDPMEISGS